MIEVLKNQQEQLQVLKTLDSLYERQLAVLGEITERAQVLWRLNPNDSFTHGYNKRTLALNAENDELLRQIDFN